MSFLPGKVKITKQVKTQTRWKSKLSASSQMEFEGFRFIKHLGEFAWLLEPTNQRFGIYIVLNFESESFISSTTLAKHWEREV